jgi:hypothetical protein
MGESSWQMPGEQALSSKRTLLFACLLGCTMVGGGDLSWGQNKPPSISLPDKIGEHISKCWAPPRPDTPQVIEVTVRLSFSQAGAVIGEPRVSYVRAPNETGLREKITASILAAIKACAPVPLTPSLGDAIAGRIFAIRFRSLPLLGKQREI